MKAKLLFYSSALTFSLFVFFSYTVAKESWQKIDFDTTVKLQDRVPREYDSFFSFFSLLGSAEVTLMVVGIMAILAVLRLKILIFLGWLLIIPASVIEVVGKVILFHPGPPVLFHRTVIETHLPSSYIHTNFSYPSGHMTRTAFILTIFATLAFLKLKGIYRVASLGLFIFMGGMMFMTRITLGEHWLSDVLGGAMLGVSTGLFSAFLMVLRKR